MSHWLLKPRIEDTSRQGLLSDQNNEFQAVAMFVANTSAENFSARCKDSSQRPACRFLMACRHACTSSTGSRCDSGGISFAEAALATKALVPPAMASRGGYPNPSAGEAINVSYMAQDEPVEFTLLDAKGKVIATQVINTTNGQVTTQLNNTANLPSALYFLEVTSGDNSTTRKVVVM